MEGFAYYTGSKNPENSSIFFKECAMLIKFGGGVVAASGSIAGNTFSRNRYGAYARARTKPVNPQTDRQSRVRAIMSLVSAQYLDSATATNRTNWGIFASNMPETNKLGDTINLSGFNQYIKSNVAAINAGLPKILDAPVVFTKPGEDPAFAVTGSEGDEEVSVTFTEGRDWVDEDEAGMIIQMGIPQNASIGFFNGPWRHAGIIEGDSIAAPTSPTVVTMPYAAVELQKVWVRGRIIRADGRLSDWFQVSFIVGA